MKRVCAYCRVSTRSTDQENSFENQKSYFERVIAENEEYEYAGIYADRGISGTKLKRPQFDRLLTDAGLDIAHEYKITAKPKFDLILVKNTSRFARNVSVDVILKALAKNNVYVYFLDLNKTTENSEDITYIQIFLTFDERESRDKSKKVLFGIEEGIRKGNIHSHGRLYGYVYHPKPENRLEILEKEAENVRMIFDLYVNQGFGFHRICNILKQKGIKSKTGKDFTDRAIRLILTNEVYTGLAVRKKYTEGLVFEKHARRESQDAVKFETDKIPAIIDRKLFDKAQEILEGRIQHQTRKGIYNGTTAYAGKIRCGCCGANYIANNSDYLAEYGRRVRVYCCSNKRKVEFDEAGNKIHLCSNPNFYETAIDRQITGTIYAFRWICRIINAIQVLNKIQKALKGRINKQDEREAEMVQMELEMVTARKLRLLDLYADGKFSKEELDSKVNPVVEQENSLREKKKALTRSNEDLQRDIAEIEESLANLKEQKRLREEEINSGMAKQIYTKKEILDDIESIVVMPNKSLFVTFKVYAEIDRLMQRHQHLLPEHWQDALAS